MKTTANKYHYPISMCLGIALLSLGAATASFAEELTKNMVQDMVLKAQAQPIDQNLVKTYDFHSIEIAPARHLSNAEALSEHILPDKLINYVRLDWTTHSTYGTIAHIHDKVDTLIFYKDDFGKWTFNSTGSHKDVERIERVK